MSTGKGLALLTPCAGDVCAEAAVRRGSRVGSPGSRPAVTQLGRGGNSEGPQMPGRGLTSVERVVEGALEPALRAVP